MTNCQIDAPGTLNSIGENAVILHRKLARFRLVEFENPLAREALASTDNDDIRRLEKQIGDALQIDPQLIMIGRLMFKSVREQSRNSESSILVVGTTGEPRTLKTCPPFFVQSMKQSEKGSLRSTRLLSMRTSERRGVAKRIIRPR